MLVSPLARSAVLVASVGEVMDKVVGGTVAHGIAGYYFKPPAAAKPIPKLSMAIVFFLFFII